MNSKKNLIIYYSRTGTSEIIARSLREKLACEMNRIDYMAERDRIPFVAAVWEAVRRASTEIQGDSHDPANYDRVFFVSPVWASKLSTPIRSYMRANRDKIRSYSLLITCGGRSLEKVKKDAVAAMKKPPETSVEFLTQQVNDGHYDLDRLFRQYKDSKIPT